MSDERHYGISRRQVLGASLGVSLGALSTQVFGAPRPDGALKGRRVLIATGEFGEALETYYLIFRLLEEGAVPVVAAPTKKRLQLVVHDFEPEYEGYTEKLGYQLDVDVAYADVRPDDYAGLLIPGGRAPEEIRQDDDLVAIVGNFLDQKKPIGAMCHGVMLIYTARPIRGRTMTAYAGIAKDIELLGATYVDKAVVTDGALVTSRGWPDLPAFMPTFVDLLKG